jgi:hypothetical protein
MNDIGYVGREVDAGSIPSGHRKLSAGNRCVSAVAAVLLSVLACIGTANAAFNFREVAVTAEYKTFSYPEANLRHDTRPNAVSDWAGFDLGGKAITNYYVQDINYSLDGGAFPTAGNIWLGAPYGGAMDVGRCERKRLEFECTDRTKRLTRNGVTHSGDHWGSASGAFRSDDTVNGKPFTVALKSYSTSRTSDAGGDNEQVRVAVTTTTTPDISTGQPRAFAMMLAGLGLMGFVVSRRQS